MLKPEVMVAQAKEKFDEQGNLTDEKTKEKVQKLVTSLIAWSQKFV
jgi:chromate reductase